MIRGKRASGGKRLALRVARNRARRAVAPHMRIPGVDVQVIHGRLKQIDADIAARRGAVVDLAKYRKKGCSNENPRTGSA